MSSIPETDFNHVQAPWPGRLDVDTGMLTTGIYEGFNAIVTSRIPLVQAADPHLRAARPASRLERP
jgi:hypothetical protein